MIDGGTVTIQKDGQTIDTVKTKDETYWAINNSKGQLAEINVKDQLIAVYDNDLLIITHTDNTGHSKLAFDTEYTVDLSQLISGETTKTFRTKPAPAITGNTITVGKEGNFHGIQGALSYLQKTGATGDWTISVAEGTYHERLAYYGSANVTIAGPEDDNYGKKAVIDWKNNDTWNTGTRARANFLWQGGNLTLKNITLKSTYLRSEDGSGSNNSNEVLYFDSAAYLVAYNASFLGHQDTLLLGNNGGRAWFYKSYIEGDVDFIWGTADVALFEDCALHITGDDTNTGYIFASRTKTENEVNKGFVLLNSTVTVDDGVTAYYGRNSGSDTQAAVIGTSFTSVNPLLWQSASGKEVKDPLGDIAIAYKDYGNKTADGTAIATSGRRDGTYDMAERIINREYNGRWVILNRGYSEETKAYKNASTIWDISAYETAFYAPADASVENIFVDPVFVKNLVSTKTVKLTPSAATKTGLTYSYESDNPKITVASDGTVTPTAGEDGTATITVTASNGKKDTAKITVIASEIEATALSFSTIRPTMHLWEMQEINVAFTPADASDQTVVWEVSGDIKIVDVANSILIDTVTTETEGASVIIQAIGTGKGTITAKSEKYTGATPATQEITVDAVVDYNSWDAGVLKNKDLYGQLNFQGQNGIWHDIVVKSPSSQKIQASLATDATYKYRVQTRGVTLYIPVSGNKTIDIITNSSGNVFTDGDDNKPNETTDTDTASSFKYHYTFTYVKATDSAKTVSGTALKAEWDTWTIAQFYNRADAEPDPNKTYFVVNVGSSDRYWAEILVADYDFNEVDATGISLNKKTAEVMVGSTLTLNATITPENSTETVVWESSDPTVATVAKGIVTPLAVTEEKTVTITAKTSGGAYSDTCTVTVKPLPTVLDEVVWDFTIKDGNQAGAVLLSETETFKDGTELNGKTGFARGTTAQKLIVVDASKGKLSVRRGNGDAQFNTGTSLKVPVSAGSVLTVTGRGNSGERNTYTVNGISNDENTVSYTADSAGYVEIVAVANDYLYKISVTNVKIADTHLAPATLKNSPVESMSFEETAKTLSAGGSVELQAILSPAGRTDKVTWESSNSNVATVAPSAGDSKAKVTAVANGTATITAKAGNQSATFTVTVESEAATVNITWDFAQAGNLKRFESYNNGEYTTTASTNSGYVLGTSTQVALYITGGTYRENGNSVQFSAGTKIFVPVSANSIITVIAYDDSEEYGCKGFSVSGTTMTSQQHSYTVTEAGFVEIDAVKGNYLKSIAVTNVTCTDVLGMLADAPSHVVTATLQ